MRRRVDAVEQRARFGRIEHRRLPGRHDVPGPAHRCGRVDRHDLAGDEPIEQMADRGEPLLDARRGELARAGLDPGGDVHRLDGGDRRHAGARAPGQEFLGGAGIGPARVRVADVGREEFEEAHRGALAGGGDERRHLALPCGQRHQARIHAESSGREMRNKGARRSPLSCRLKQLDLAYVL